MVLPELPDKPAAAPHADADEEHERVEDGVGAACHKVDGRDRDAREAVRDAERKRPHRHADHEGFAGARRRVLARSLHARPGRTARDVAHQGVREHVHRRRRQRRGHDAKQRARPAHDGKFLDEPLAPTERRAHREDEQGRNHKRKLLDQPFQPFGKHGRPQKHARRHRRQHLHAAPFLSSVVSPGESIPERRPNARAQAGSLRLATSTTP